MELLPLFLQYIIANVQILNVCFPNIADYIAGRWRRAVITRGDGGCVGGVMSCLQVLLVLRNQFWKTRMRKSANIHI